MALVWPFSITEAFRISPNNSRMSINADIQVRILLFYAYEYHELWKLNGLHHLLLSNKLINSLKWLEPESRAISIVNLVLMSYTWCIGGLFFNHYLAFAVQLSAPFLTLDWPEGTRISDLYLTYRNNGMLYQKTTSIIEITFLREIYFSYYHFLGVLVLSSMVVIGDYFLPSFTDKIKMY